MNPTSLNARSLQWGRWLATSTFPLLGLTLISCTSTTAPSLAQAETSSIPAKPVLTTPNQPLPYNEKYRPQFHFSPKNGWMGDPDGLIYHDGLYHMFWWGHAVSKDLVHWSELPWPMLDDGGGFKYYTGSVVVDKSNTSGLGADSMVALYTMHHEKDNSETVGLSSSQDGTDFRYFKGNPVLDVQSTDFRDPQVFWHAPTQRWMMVIARSGERKISIYSSSNLKNWQHQSDFGTLGAQGNNWEVPDLFPLAVDGNANQTKWVLTVGVGPNKTQYFLGDFDGRRFTPDEATKNYLAQKTPVEGTVFSGFDGKTYGNWTVTGTAFGNGPSQGDLPGHLGAGYIDSFGGGDNAIGTLTSPPFQITRNAINFLIAGGNHPNQTCINLRVDGKVMRTTTGDGSGILKWTGWDVSDLIGQTAQIELKDNYRGDDFGHFMADNITFADKVKQEENERALWADYGSDFYAARTWRNGDGLQNRTLWLGWMGNWDYANDVPSSWGKGFSSLPRELALKTFPEGIRLVQTPISELQSLRETPVHLTNLTLPQSTKALAGVSPKRNTYEIEATFSSNANAKFGLNLLAGERRKLVLSYDAKTSQLTLDRTQTSDFTSNATFNSKFPKVMSAPLALRDGILKLRIFVDQSSVEVIADSGQVVLSALTFPGATQTGIETVSERGSAQLTSFTLWPLKSIWNPDTVSIPGTLEAKSFDAQGRRTHHIQADYTRTYIVTTEATGQGGQLSLELDGRKISEAIKVSASKGAQKTAITTQIPISIGQHQLSFCIESGTFKLGNVRIATQGSEIVSGGLYEVAARHSGRVLDASGNDEGAAIQQWQRLGGENQKWKIEAIGNGLYKLTSQSSGKVLDVNGDENGTGAQQWPWQNNDNQKWEISEVGGGYYTLRKKNGKALEVNEFSKQNGGKVQQWEYLGGASQQWKLTKVSASNR